VQVTTRPLDGLRVLECGHFIAGPRCAQILGDHGAEVIKLEPPNGDPARRSPPRLSEWSLYFAAHNRGKQSIAVDLKNPDGREILARLVRWADVIVTNFTPSASERLGLDFESASRLNPTIVVVRISAYGVSGSDRDLPGFDGTVQATSGFAHMVGPGDRPPTVTSVPLLDYVAAIEGAFGALLGLRRRDLTGVGQEIDASMMDAASTLLGYLYAEVLVSGRSPMRTGSHAPYALTGAYAASDGFVYIAPMGDAAWTALCNLIGRPDWAKAGSPYFDPESRLRDRIAIEAAIERWTRGLDRATLIATLKAAGIPCGPMRSVEEVANDPRLRERRMLTDVRLGATAEHVPMPGIEVKVSGSEGPAASPVVPALGADTDAILSRLGYESAEIERLRNAGAIR
jgi:crotonobetainyl-CoA:carnitine CoA-transferase CaiB-like acyl-CoA transferase